MTWYAHLTSLQQQRAKHASLLDDAERTRAARFRQEVDRERFISAHGLLREVLGRCLGQAPGELVFQRGEFGKPYLEGHPLHFNLSDTKDAVLIAVADQPIGADVETVHRHTDQEQVAGHYFTSAEVASIQEAQDGKRRFLELWTRKEAVLKACGVGLMDDLKKLEVGRDENRMRIAHPDFVRLAAPAYHVYTLYPDADHPMSIALPRPAGTIRLFGAGA
jgi:4'-phosphopantetheinyl transferase